MLNREVKDIELKKGMSALDIVNAMGASGGFTAKKVADGVDILHEMIESKSFNFLSFPACIIATGARGVIREMLKEKWFGAVITTCGTIDHDLARAWSKYYHGDFMLDDAELHRKSINRLGNVLIPYNNYGKVIEDKVQPILKELWDQGRRSMTTRDLLWEFGKRIESEDSLLHWCYRNKIPMFVPGITDGAFGSQLWSFWQDHRAFAIDVLGDENLLADIAFTQERTGALVIGGGISKHHLIWWNQFKGGLDYAVYITTAQEYDGSLSGAMTREAVSWGKVHEGARHVTIEADATTVLPLMVVALMEKSKD